jgi:hypothetical protein
MFRSFVPYVGVSTDATDDGPSCVWGVLVLSVSNERKVVVNLTAID